MIIIMNPEATKPQVEHMIERVESMGLRSRPIYGELHTVIAVVGDVTDEHRESLSIGPGVHEVLRVQSPYKLASREVHHDPTVIRTGSLTIGGGQIAVIAGPCSVESREQMLTTAEGVKRLGACAMRGGAFKPRTSPYSFQGLKDEGLKILAEAREATGLSIVTEVVAASDVELVSQYADVLQVGARNMQNYQLLEAVGDCDRPVLLKRSASGTLDELLLAAEYILDRGNPNVMLCERGIRTFESHVRFTLTLASVPYLHERTHLPILVDPSHGVGRSSLIPKMSAAALAAGADGLLIEVHPNPEMALCDGPQSLNLDAFEETMTMCRKIIEATGGTLAEATTAEV